MPPQLKLFCCGDQTRDKQGNSYALVTGSNLVCEMCEQCRCVGYMTRTRVRDEFVCNRCVFVIAGHYNPHLLFHKTKKCVWTGEKWSPHHYEGKVFNNKTEAMAEHRLSFGNGKHLVVISKAELENL